MLASLVQISNFTPFRNLLCDTNRSKLANLKILLMRAIPSALFWLGTKKKISPTITSTVSTLFHL